MKFLSIVLLSLIISIVSIPLLIGQNTPASNSFHGAISVSPSSPTGALAINPVGDVQIGPNTTLDMFELASQNVTYGENLESNAGNFKRHLTGTAAAIQMASGDIFFRTFATGSAGSTAAPLTAFQIKNGAPSTSMLLDATGNLTMPALKSTTGTRYVCVDTAGKLISSTTACSGT